MSQEVFIDPSDVAALQRFGLQQQLVGLDPNADANAPRRVIAPPSEIVMGAGKPYKARIAFLSADPTKRWKLHQFQKDGVTPLAQNYVGCMIQYSLFDTPQNQYDGAIITEYVMTLIQRSGTCSAMAVLQAMGVWNQSMLSGDAMYQALNAAIPRGFVVGVHVDWRGQRIKCKKGPDGRIALGPDGQPLSTDKLYEDVDGMNSWRVFWEMDTAKREGQRIPASRIEIRDETGKPKWDVDGPIIYVAKADIVRRECIAPNQASGPLQGAGFGQPQQQPGFGGAGFGSAPFGAPQMPPFGAPPPQQFAQPPAQYSQPPAQQWSAPPPQQQAPPPQQLTQPGYYPPQQPAPPQSPQQQQAPVYQPPQAAAPWQQPAPQWQQQQPQQQQPQQPGAPSPYGEKLSF